MMAAKNVTGKTVKHKPKLTQLNRGVKKTSSTSESLGLSSGLSSCTQRRVKRRSTRSSSHAVDTKPGVSKKRKQNKKRKKYGWEQIDHAIDDIKGGMSTKQAAHKWQVPRTTLQNRKKSGFKDVGLVRPGPPTVLTGDEETVLCDWLIELSHRGIPVQKEQFLDSIQKILTDDPRPNPFTNNKPGKGWFKA